LISVDLNKPSSEQPTPLHNRWHPDIPPVAEVSPSDVFKVECLDCSGGAVKKSDSVEDILKGEFSAHYMSGPIAVKGAEPGDLLAVDILDIGPLPGAEWGFTAIFPKHLGGGFLDDHFPNVLLKAIWDFEGIYAVSKHIPGVRIAGIPHTGVIGCAPSHELLSKWNEREKALVDTDPHRVPELACLPSPHKALLGKLEQYTGSSHYDFVATSAARTIPPRENGGNCDIKNLSKGARVFLPVFVNGANLSIGDLHFSEGDGEIAFCGAIEMAGFVNLKVDLIKGGMKLYKTVMPIFIPGPVEPRYSYITFEGISVDEGGKQHYLDATLAFRMACLNAIEYTKEQAYLILSTAPVEGRINGMQITPAQADKSLRWRPPATRYSRKKFGGRLVRSSFGLFFRCQPKFP